ncbi:MarR family transcriptional regulator [Altererythrobacter sp. JGD-16]|uniref:MarR family transcriptional regulator n=2 Tax=Altererythrobacter lutimaris TaxID=2743979 RepID=A0A850HHT2_9SPHN|nr:MarR family transcriptional regulator [Altererythrobacter lutimaris]
MLMLDDPLNCVCANFRRAARHVTRQYDAALEPSGLNTGQFTTLVALQRTGGMIVSELADLLGLERTAMTRNLRVLEKDGLVLRELGEDRRERRITLTRQGQNRLEQAQPLWAKAQSRLIAAIGSDDAIQLLNRLRVFA